LIIGKEIEAEYR